MVTKNIKILFRTAGGKARKKELGLGHIYRCINLASEFKKNRVFFLIEDYGGVKQIIEKNGFKNHVIIKNGVSLNNDIKSTIKVIEENKIDILIIDNFHLKKEYAKKLKKIVKVVVITDLENIEFEADLLVNGFVGFKNGIIKNKYKTKCLLGPKYQILNKNFSKKIISNKEKYKLLVTLGGLDEKNISEVILEELINLNVKIKSKIILGPVSTQSQNYKKLFKKKPKFIEIKNETSDMEKDISESEYGICTGGLTTYEFASRKVPFAIICDENHQLKTAKHWEQKKIAKNFGTVNKKTKYKIKKLLLSIAEKKSIKNNKKRILDGKGIFRVVNEILKMS